MGGVESRISTGLDGETSRRNFLKTAAWTGAALSAMGIGGLGVAVRRADAQAAQYKSYQGLGDAAILQFAYQLELLEGTFYDEGVNAGIFKDAFLEQIVAIRDHEMAHADAIAKTLGQLGAEVPATPQFTFPCGDDPGRGPRRGSTVHGLLHAQHRRRRVPRQEQLRTHLAPRITGRCGL
jgi:hypothetical protein